MREEVATGNFHAILILNLVGAHVLSPPAAESRLLEVSASAGQVGAPGIVLEDIANCDRHLPGLGEVDHGAVATADRLSLSAIGHKGVLLGPVNLAKTVAPNAQAVFGAVVMAITATI